MRRLHTRKRCKASGKRKYHSQLDALLAYCDGMRAYRCPDCGFWHLTKQRAPNRYWQERAAA